MRPIRDINRVLDDYDLYLQMEKGMAVNSRDAYRRDVGKLLSFLAGEDIAPEEATLENLRIFIGELNDLGIAARSRSRIISGIRSFFHYLSVENYIDSNPCELLETPFLGYHLPEVLTLDEINDMVAAINPDKAEAQRDRAIIETLYGCGLRVSELVDLEMSKIYTEEGYLVVRGKGNKERMVPMSEVSIHEINRYLEEFRSYLNVKPDCANILFLNRRGGKLTRVRIFQIIKDLAEAAGIRKTLLPTHCATLSPPTFLKEAPTSVPSSKCWAMKASRPRKSISISTARRSARTSSPSIPETTCRSQQIKKLFKKPERSMAGTLRFYYIPSVELTDFIL